jgi:hypothetical protein
MVLPAVKFFPWEVKQKFVVLKNYAKLFTLEDQENFLHSRVNVLRTSCILRNLMSDGVSTSDTQRRFSQLIGCLKFPSMVAVFIMKLLAIYITPRRVYAFEAFLVA